MKKYIVRAEIRGEFVTKDAFDTKEEAMARYDKLHDDFIYDELDIYEEDKWTSIEQ